MYVFQFIISTVVIIVAGVRLTRYADLLSDKLHLGKVWIGVVILGLVTSLPEAITTIVSVVSLHANDLAIGNIVGSNNFNPMLIVLMDAVYRKSSVTDLIKTDRSHYLSAGFAVLLTFILLIELISGAVDIAGPISLGSWIIVILYFLGMKLIASESSTVGGLPPQAVNDKAAVDVSLKRIGFNLLMSALFVVGGAVFLADSADQIANSTGLGRTFVGSIFLAMVTSLPEMVVTLSAVKIGAFDLAVGNVFGSNMTNIFILPVCNFFYPKISILENVSQNHIFTALMSVILTLIVICGIRSKNKVKILGLGWDSWLMAGVFSTTIYFLYMWR